ncbi:MAG TPA: hypothetical protein VFE58_15790 [Tepidisphaeraceae bacterium]|nr:hypothetical protein [Tepidisphaeraceae bacterium]
MPPSLRRSSILFTTLILSLSCASHHHHHPTTRHLTTRPATHPTTSPTIQPLLDTRHGTGSFPLAGPKPITSLSILSSSLHAGYLTRLTPPDPSNFLTVQGSLPSLKLLHIDVSNAHMRPDYRPAEFTKKVRTERSFTVHRLEYIAEPLHYDEASASIHLFADDARLDLLRDDKNTQGLILAGARQGQFKFHVSSEDLNKFLTIAPHADDSSFTVLRAKLALACDNPHTLCADLDIRARWVLLPLTFSFHGRLTTTSTGSVTFTELSITGYDPGGLLVAALVNPSLHKLNGKSQPIISLPDPQTHITNVTFSNQSGLTITIDFAQQ